MPNVLNEQLADATSYGNIKGLADMAQTAMNLSTQNAVANQQGVQAMINSNLQNGLALSQSIMANAVNQATAVQARALRFLFDTSAEEAVSFTKQIGSDLAGQLAQMGGQLASIQEQAKIANTTPPQTGTGGAFGADSGSALNQQLANLSASIAAIEAMLNRKAP